MRELFDLEQAISDWRARMTAGGVKDASVLDELESHLREEVRCRIKAGAAEEPAVDARNPSVVRARGQFSGGIRVVRHVAHRAQRAAWQLVADGSVRGLSRFSLRHRVCAPAEGSGFMRKEFYV